MSGFDLRMPCVGPVHAWKARRQPSFLPLLVVLISALASPAVSRSRSDSDTATRAIYRPPHVSAAVLRAARLNDNRNAELKQWTADNIKVLEYNILSGAFESKRQIIEDAAANDLVEVVLVTQGSTARLGAFQTAFSNWRGPTSFAVYIEYEEGTPEASECRDHVLRFLYDVVFTAFHEPEEVPPLSVSFLHTKTPLENAGCHVSVPGEEEENAAKARAWARSQPDLYPPEDVGAKEDGVGGVRRMMQRRSDDKLPAVGEEYVAHYDSLYPVNALRNLAWSQVPDGLFVFLLDVDFIPTQTLHDDLTHGRWQSKLEKMRENFRKSGARETLVVSGYERLSVKPTYLGTPVVKPFDVSEDEEHFGDACGAEDGCEIVNGVELPRNRATLKRFIRERTGLAELFHASKAPNGHGCYADLPWLDNDDPDKLMEFEYRYGCEPYVIGLSEALPRYDERFRGRYQDKIQQLKHMSLWQFKWELLPDHFALHLPHPSAPSGQAKFQVSQTASVLMRVFGEEAERAWEEAQLQSS